MSIAAPSVARHDDCDEGVVRIDVAYQAKKMEAQWREDEAQRKAFLKEDQEEEREKRRRLEEFELERWKKEQEEVSKWEVKELLRFLDAAGASYHEFSDKKELIETVQSVQANFLSRMLKKAEQGAWEEVFCFLGNNIDSLNSRPPNEKYCFIHHAAAKGKLCTVKQLLKLSADLARLSLDGQTAQEVAHACGCKSIAEFLRCMAWKGTENWQNDHQITDILGYETTAALTFRRTASTLFETQDDPVVLTFSKIASTDAWDAHATSCSSSVTRVTAALTKHATCHTSGIATRDHGPFLMGLTTCAQDTYRFRYGFAVLFGEGSAMLKGIRRQSALCRWSYLAHWHVVENVGPSDLLEMVIEDGDIKVLMNGKLLKTVRAKAKEMYAKVFIRKANDCLTTTAWPLASLPQQIAMAIHVRAPDFRVMLRSVLLKLMPEWLGTELAGKDQDPEDSQGHVMYIASLIVMLIARSWTPQEAKALDVIDRKNNQIPFNYEWTTDLWKVLKRIWNNGGAPKLDNLRDEHHSKIPGSCKNKAVLALAFVNVIRPAHQWVAWTVWRERQDEEAKDRFPNKSPETMCYTQLHCVCCHVGTRRWFDVIRFWDRDPLHAWPMRYPDPELVNAPTPQNFDLACHTRWLRYKAGPKGASGYSCPMEVRGVVPVKLANFGVKGQRSQLNGEDEEEEDDDGDEVLHDPAA